MNLVLIIVHQHTSGMPRDTKVCHPRREHLLPKRNQLLFTHRIVAIWFCHISKRYGYKLLRNKVHCVFHCYNASFDIYLPDDFIFVLSPNDQSKILFKIAFCL